MSRQGWFSPAEVGRLEDIVGRVLVRSTQGVWRVASLGLPLRVGDIISAGPGDSASVSLRGGSQVRVAGPAMLEVLAAESGVPVVGLCSGQLWTDGRVEVHTPAAVALAAAGEYGLKVGPADESLLAVASGKVRYVSPEGGVEAREGTGSVARPLEPPSAPFSIRFSDLFGWVRPIPRLMFYFSQYGLEREANRLERRLAASPDDAAAHSSLSVIYRKMGRLAEAVAHGERALDLEPSQAIHHQRLGYVLSATDRARARAELQQATELDPSLPLGWVYLSLITQDEADLDRALSAEAKNVEALTLKGVRARQRGETASAIALFTEAISANPSHTLPRQHLAHLLTDLGRLDEAIEQCQAGLAVDPMDAMLYYRLGYAYLSKDEPQKALAAFEKAAGLPLGGSDPAWRQIFITSVGKARAALNDPAGAEAEFRKALELDPNFGTPQNELALFLADRGERLEEAIEHAKLAVQASPESAAYRDTLGWAYFRAGQLEEASVQLSRAVELDPSGPEALWHLGLVMEQRGELQEARLLYGRAIEAVPTFEPARQALRRLGVSTN